MADYLQKWHDAFVDPAGGFHERLDNNLKPLDQPKRLVTQCRQLFVYLSNGMNVGPQYDYLVKNYRVAETGGSRFSLADDKYDLYGLSFVLLAAAAMRHSAYARETITFIDNHFRVPGRIGYANALTRDLKVIESEPLQNPHMHLLEGVLAMSVISGEEIYRDFANEMIDLFFSAFFDGVVHETVNGEAIEAGHQAEWIWLLKRYRDISGADDPRITDAMASLYDWLRQHGRDPEYGGVFNAQKRDGSVLDANKRIWPVCETIRAARIMGDDAMAQDLVRVLKTKYMRPDGFWTEILNRDLSPATDYLPGTTPYHLCAVLSDLRA